MIEKMDLLTLKKVLKEEYYYEAIDYLDDIIEGGQLDIRIRITDDYESKVRLGLILLSLPCLDRIYKTGHSEPSQTLLYFYPVGMLKNGRMGIKLHCLHLLAHCLELNMYQRLGLPIRPRHNSVFSIELYKLLERDEPC